MFRAISVHFLVAFTLSISLLSPLTARASYRGEQEYQTSGYGNSGKYPLRPDPVMTPGQLCPNPTRYRYPEHIKYCDRDVSPETKWQVIKNYVAKFGYDINSGNRMSFKIDHYIPLCMGGSNEISNLWPQHVSVYQQTDPMEPLMCEKMSQGRLKQAEAIELIKKGKNDFSQIKGILAYVSRL